MSEITLSKAVRSNLLNLQSTAELLSKSQERLSTGLRVNSALDNPTNFFTAQGLNSRASDLSQLLDAVSNAVQTVAAADKGITAITKLVEFAQATARQALQTSATVAATPVSLATSASGNTTSVTISDGTAQAGTITAGAFTTLDLSGAGSPATSAEITGGAFTTVDVSGGSDAISFTVTLDGDEYDITINSAAVSAYNLAETATLDEEALTAEDIANLINFQVGTDIADEDGGVVVLTSTTEGEDSTLEITGYTATVTAGVTGLANTAEVAGDNLTTADSISFSLAIDGDTTPTLITIDADAVDAYNTANTATLDPAALTAEDLALLINDLAGDDIVTTATGGPLVFTSTTEGASSAVAITGYTASVTAGSTGISNNSDSGVGVGTDTTGDIVVNGQTISLESGDDAAAILLKFQAAATASTGADAFTVSSTDGVITITGTGGNDVVISGDDAAVGALGLTEGTVDGTPAAAAGANPKRAELVETYNDLLEQIDQLAKDSGFNGVNLLGGDNLSVLFNEDGTSKLDIAGVTNDASNLGLAVLNTTGFDTNAAINTTLDNLKGAIDTLRTQASKFGSNLSVVETRQDFTKQMINVLQTGAANLTLADTNEEAANVLALQTRQQLSSTALSLASQADQNVLRLF